jgi:hypothetical protein
MVLLVKSCCSYLVASSFSAFSLTIFCSDSLLRVSRVACSCATRELRSQPCNRERSGHSPATERGQVTVLQQRGVKTRNCRIERSDQSPATEKGQVTALQQRKSGHNCKREWSGHTPSIERGQVTALQQRDVRSQPRTARGKVTALQQ